MATSTILEFCPTDTGTNLLSNAEYSAASARDEGVSEGVAISKLYNKSARQSSLISAGIAKYIADNQSTNISDSLTVANIAAYFTAANATKIAEDFYTKTAADARYYTQSYIAANYYTQSYIAANYYTQSTIDSNFYTKTAADARYYQVNPFFEISTESAQDGIKLDSASTRGSYVGFYKNGARSGIIGMNGVIVGDTSNGLSLVSDIGSLRFYTDGTATVKAELDSAGNLRLPAGSFIGNMSGGTVSASTIDATTITASNNFVIGTAGKGLDFSVNGGSSTILDDYAVGTWSPTLTTTGGSLTTPSLNSGAFVKVGRLCTCNYYVTWNNKSSPTGVLSIGNLPFPFASGALGRITLNLFPTLYSGSTVSPAGGCAGVFLEQDVANSRFNVWISQDGTDINPYRSLDASLLGISGTIQGSFSYFTD